MRLRTVREPRVPYVYTKLCRQQAKTMKIEMFAIFGKAKPDTGNTRGLNLVTVTFMIAQVSKLP